MKIHSVTSPFVETNYFGHRLTVHESTVAIAMDENGSVYAFKSIPKTDMRKKDGAVLDLGFWYDGKGDAELLTAYKFTGNWKDSLLVLEKS